MPPLPDPVVYAIGQSADPDRITRRVAAEPSGRARVVDRILLDTFDGRLRRQNLSVWRDARVTWGRLTLTLEASGRPTVSVPVDRPTGGPDRLLAADLPTGPVWEPVREAIDERALLARVRVRSRFTPYRVCDDEGKTVVRLQVEEPAVVNRGGSEHPLEPRLAVSGLLGYGRDHERVTAILDRRLERGARSLPEDALIVAGVPPKGVSSDVDVALKPGMRADRATSLICRRLADVVDANLPGTIDDIDPEFLHDLRVAVRRSRSVLKEMRGVLAPDESERARTDLKWIQEVTGPTRDLDVLLHDWPGMVGPVPASMAGDLQPLVDILHRARAEAFRTMRRNLRSRRFQSAWSSWRATVEHRKYDGEDSGRPIGELAGGRIVAVYRGMTRQGSRIDDASPPEALHDLRKRGKELRYLLELFGGMWPADKVKPLVSALKGLQDELGHFQDDEIQVRELRSLGPELAAALGGTDSLIALGFVVEGLSARQAQARADFERRFASFASDETRRVVRTTFGTTGG
ncbi:MAG TPA: CHAD domain-containing protein [Acidimicrobiales bacterium]|jgi:CHAD domain-containing protein|nr:CHAD domain-containing protein [Acidimicrobiales bacterium]